MTADTMFNRVRYGMQELQDCILPLCPLNLNVVAPPLQKPLKEKAANHSVYTELRFLYATVEQHTRRARLLGLSYLHEMV